MTFIPDETYVATLARYRSTVCRLEAGHLRTIELLVRSERAIGRSRELLATPAPRFGPDDNVPIYRKLKIQTD